MKKPFILAFFLCFIAVPTLTAKSENVSDTAYPSEKTILKHIQVPEGSTCKIVAKQKIYDGN